MAERASTRRRLAGSIGLLLTVLLAAFLPIRCRAENNIKADRIVVLKSQRTMHLYKGAQILKSYKVALGGEPRGPKTMKGDHRTPEGIYQIDGKNKASQFHRSLHISYPSQQDRARARKLGVNPGGDIMIHGLPPRYAFVGASHTAVDWTDGCIAVTDSEIEEIWDLVPVGTRIEIRP